MLRALMIWSALAVAVAVPIGFSAVSPLLAWRQPVYIAAGFAGVAALTLLLVQPLLIAGYLPGLHNTRGRRGHRWIGALLLFAVVVHVAGLWITSPPDVIDALLFVSPTPFSVWGVMAMWAVFASAALVAFRRRLRLRIRGWRLTHSALALIIVSGTVVHALLIEGTMEPISKAMLCVLVAIATAAALINRRVWARNGP